MKSETMVDPSFMKAVRKYGAYDVRACFNCGNCTAVCPLSEGRDAFPRKLIRYAQIGRRDLVLGSKEMWLCYYCGECSDTCPRQAEPGEFMASLRRYAIASFDPTGLSRLLYRSPFFSVLFVVVLAAVLALVLLSGRGPMRSDAPALFSYLGSEGFLSFALIHDMGIVVIAVSVIAASAGVLRMVFLLRRLLASSEKAKGKEKAPGLGSRLAAALRAVVIELAAQKRYADCEKYGPRDPWYRNRRVVHWAIMWGFLALAAATAIDYLWMLVAGKNPGQPDPFWYPGRLIGTAGGIVFLYGVVAALIMRVAKSNTYDAHSLLSDWLFLILLFLAGISGFIVEAAVYLPFGAAWSYGAFLFHVAVAMEVVLLLPFTKFAHAVYRPLALFVHSFTRPQPSE